MRTPTTLQFYHSDHLGSTNVVTDATGAVVEYREYTPFGSVAVQSPEPAASPAPTGELPLESGSPFGFTGQREDATNGLILFPGRAYDPQLGRFLQADPFVQDPADPQTLNRYSYVRNNPVNFVDPSGYVFGWDDALYWLIYLAITAGVTYATWPFDEDFDPALLRDTGIRFLQNLPAPSLVDPHPFSTEGIFERFSTFATRPAVAGTASFVSGFVPIAGEAQDFAGAVYGVDLITAERLSPWERGLSGAMLLVPLVGAVSIRHGVRGLNDVIPNGAKYVYDATVKRYRHVLSGRFVTGRNLPFPSNDGFRIRSRGTLKPGKMIDRYGSPHGGFASDIGASISSRGLPPGSKALEYHRYQVMRSFDVDMGPAAAVPDFAATGGAKQYLFGRPISELVDEGYLREQ